MCRNQIWAWKSNKEGGRKKEKPDWNRAPLPLYLPASKEGKAAHTIVDRCFAFFSNLILFILPLMALVLANIMLEMVKSAK